MTKLIDHLEWLLKKATKHLTEYEIDFLAAASRGGKLHLESLLALCDQAKEANTFRNSAPDLIAAVRALQYYSAIRGALGETARAALAPFTEEMK